MKIRLYHNIQILFCIILFIIFAYALSFSSPFSVTVEPKNLGTPVNSSDFEYAPSISPNGEYMLFNSKRGRKYQDIYISNYNNGIWSEPKPFHVLNSPYNDETPFISYDGNIIIFSSDRDGSKEMPRNSRNQVRVSFDLYWSKRVGNSWSKPVSIPGFVNSIHHEKAPNLSKDGKTLYFTSWQFGSIKVTKIMKSVFQNGKFSKPELLPKPFNTGHQDLALISAEEEKGFFFSSRRPGGFGGWDLYFVSYEDGKYGVPKNLGKFINSDKNELFLTRIDQRFFICSNRDGGKGLFDIYSSFIFQKNTNFETRAIHFDFNSYEIKEESFSYLKALSKFLNENKNIRIKIIGHTDLNGSVEFNFGLSLKRAEAVGDYLVKSGIARSRLKLDGAGKSKPVINSLGKEFDERNRRTEFIIVK